MIISFFSDSLIFFPRILWCSERLGHPVGLRISAMRNADSEAVHHQTVADSAFDNLSLPIQPRQTLFAYVAFGELSPPIRPPANSLRRFDLRQTPLADSTFEKRSSPMTGPSQFSSTIALHISRLFARILSSTMRPSKFFHRRFALQNLSSPSRPSQIFRRRLRLQKSFVDDRPSQFFR
jgi:hypothetical protein